MNDTEQIPTTTGKKLEAHIATLLTNLADETQRVHRLVNWLNRHKAEIERLTITPVAWCNHIDFNYPSREQVLEIIKAFPGKWEKQMNHATGSPKMDYSRFDEESELTLRIWAGELPPTCRLIEEEYEVPAHTAKRIKVECAPEKNGSATLKEVEAA